MVSGWPTRSTAKKKEPLSFASHPRGAEERGGGGGRGSTQAGRQDTLNP